MSEEILPAVGKVKERVWVGWVLIYMRLLSRNANSTGRYEVSWRIRDWFSAPNHVKIKQPVMSHAEPDGSALQELFDATAISFQIIPLFGFTCVLTPVDGIKSATFWAGGLIRTSCE